MEMQVSWDWAIAAQIVTAATGIGALLFILSQMKLTQRLARESSFLNFVATEEVAKLEAGVDDAMRQLHMPSLMQRPHNPLTAEEAETLLGDTFATRSLNAYLNHLQNLAVAREFKVVHWDIWEKVHGPRFRWWAVFLAEYINRARVRFRDPLMWDLVVAERSS